MPLTSDQMLGAYGIVSPLGAGAWALFSGL